MQLKKSEQLIALSPFQIFKMQFSQAEIICSSKFGYDDKIHCEAYKHFSQLCLEAALVLILNSLCMPMPQNAKNKEENVQEMED